MAGQQQGEQTSPVLVIMLVVFVLGAVAWFIFKAQLVGALFTVKYAELSVMWYVVKGYNYIAHALFLPVVDLENSKIGLYMAYIRQASYENVDINTITSLCKYVGQYGAGVVACFFVFIAFFSLKMSKLGHFSSRHSMKSLLGKECNLWPIVKPSMKENLVKTSIHEGPWAMAKNPLNFSLTEELLDKDELEKSQLVLLKGRAYRTFSLQLGRRWRGPQHLPPHLKLLFVCFYASMSYEKEKISNPLLNQVAHSYTGKSADFSGVDELALKYSDSKVCRFLNEHHTYESTAMASMLVFARQSGVFSSSEFLWLKTIDRLSWYMLNSVGRYTPVCEVAGVYAHWVAEKKLKRAIEVPVVKEAVLALEEALSLTLYQADDMT